MLSFYLTQEDIVVLSDLGRCCRFLSDSGRCCRFLSDSGRCGRFLSDSGRCCRFYLIQEYVVVFLSY